jgi:hypothetical protein
MDRVLLVDVDGKRPNLALMKLSTYFKGYGNAVDLKRLHLTYYKMPRNKKVVNGAGYRAVYLSILYPINRDVISVVGCDQVVYGGTGYDLTVALPPSIDNLPEDYSIYPENDASYGFITRGCIRDCSFCFVPKKEGLIYKYRDPEQIIRHKKVIFMDNNFLAYRGHKDILRWLIANKIRCQFNGGLDIRLIDDENAELISRLRYIGQILFAYDRIEDSKIIEDKTAILKKYIPNDWRMTYYLYCHPSMPIEDIIYRANFCRIHRIIPYIMRDSLCFATQNKRIYLALAHYCNQPRIFKNMSFKTFKQKRYPRDAILNGIDLLDPVAKVRI